MKAKWMIVGLIVACGVGLIPFSAGKALPEDVPLMTKEELKALLDSEDVVVIDVRTPRDYGKSESKIKGAVRENPMDIRYWSPYPKDRTLVLYCA